MITRKHLTVASIIIVSCLLVLTSHSCSLFQEKKWEIRAAEITKGCNTEYEKAKAIYDWISENIKYDYTYSIYKAEEVWQTKRGVCAGFSALYEQLAKGCGLEAKVIEGIARTDDDSDGKEEHAWNKVKTEKGWILLDVTWGSCIGHNDCDESNGNEWGEYGKSSRIWFDVHPDWMIFTHFPTLLEDQLRPSPISRYQYLLLPNIEPTFGEWGWDASRTLEYFIQHPYATPPTAYSVPNELWGTNIFLEYPCSMEAGEEYTIQIRNLNPDYLPNMEQSDENIYSCTASAGYTVGIGGHAIIQYPLPGKFGHEECEQSVHYPCK